MEGEQEEPVHYFCATERFRKGESFEVFNDIADLTELRILDISCPDIYLSIRNRRKSLPPLNLCLPFFKNLKKLRCLTAYNWIISYDDIEHICRYCPALIDLYLSNFGSISKKLQRLLDLYGVCAHRSLIEFDFVGYWDSDAKVLENYLDFLCSQKELVSVNFSYPRHLCSNGDFPNLDLHVNVFTELPFLETLFVYNWRISRSSAEVLCSLRCLREIFVNNPELLEKGVCKCFLENKINVFFYQRNFLFY
jgi:hypothetical protein